MGGWILLSVNLVIAVAMLGQTFEAVLKEHSAGKGVGGAMFFALALCNSIFIFNRL